MAAAPSATLSMLLISPDGEMNQKSQRMPDSEMKPSNEQNHYPASPHEPDSAEVLELDARQELGPHN